MVKREILVYFLALTLLFGVSILAGYYNAKSDPDQARMVINQFKSEFGFIKKLPSVVIFAIIFINNSTKALVAMILGIFFGLAPILFVLINGYLIGIVLYIVGTEMGLKDVLMLLVPHGIIEIPAIIIACSYGIWLGRMFYNRVRGNESSIKPYVMHALRQYLRIVVPMLFVAAFVETYITPLLAIATA
jgi:stage II sporulation protein M